MRVVYVDILFFENLLLNYALLYSISGFCRLRASYLGMLAASTLGVLFLFALLMLDYKLGSMSLFLLKVGISCCMVIISFSCPTKNTFLRAMLLFYIASFMMGGAILGLLYLVHSDTAFYSNVIFIQDLDLKLLFAGTICGVGLIKLSFGFFIDHQQQRSNRVLIRIWNGRKSITLQAMIDTGNTLRDPDSGKSVVIVYREAASKILPSGLLIRRNKESAELHELSESDKPNSSNVKEIYYRTIGMEHGVFSAFIADQVEIEEHKGNNGKTQSRTFILKVPVAIYEKPLSADREYDAIISPELYQGGSKK